MSSLVIVTAYTRHSSIAARIEAVADFHVLSLGAQPYSTGVLGTEEARENVGGTEMLEGPRGGHHDQVDPT